MPRFMWLVVIALIAYYVGANYKLGLPVLG
jgi:hypothetical protein